MKTENTNCRQPVAAALNICPLRFIMIIDAPPLQEGGQKPLRDC